MSGLICRIRDSLRRKWSALWRTKNVPFGKRTAEKYVAVGKGFDGISAHDRAQLPAALNTLYCLAGLGRKKIEDLISQGRIHPGLRLEEAKALLPEFRPGSRHPPGTSIFLTVGGGSHYLADGSLGVGTTNIDPALLADLRTRTTEAPYVYSNATISTNLTLGPYAARDTNADAVYLGYHYECLDYAFGGCDLKSNLTITAATAIGWFQNDGGDLGSEPYSITLDNGANWSLNGNATQPCYYANYTMVQEGENGAWTNSGYMGSVVLNGTSGGTLPKLSANFIKWTYYSAQGAFRDNDVAGGSGCFTNCEFYNLAMSSYKMQSLAFTNCLFFRDNLNFWFSPALAFVNCTFYNGCLSMYRSNPVLWLIENSAFDGTLFEWQDSYDETNYTTINYNAYNTNNLSWMDYPYESGTRSGTLENNGPNTVDVTNFNWETSWFGNFYQPTNSLREHKC